jgi:molecular chaperone DnaJ
MANFYEILGVAPTATTETIRRAFRDRAKERHPDTEAGTEAAMVRLNQAYDTLKDARKRRAYDATLAPVLTPFEAPPRPTRPKPRPTGGADPLLFLMQVFHPLDRKLAQALLDLHSAIEEVAYDIYDDTYVGRFEKAVLQTERILTGLDQILQRSDWPAPLMNALNLYSQGIRQVEDALGDFRDFSQNYDVDQLVQGRAILDAASELLDEARDDMDRR